MKDTHRKENTNCPTEINGRLFDSEYLKRDLKERSIRGGAITMTAQAVQFLLHMGSTIVLARLLTPQDFGLVAMITAVIGFVGMFKDMGLSTVTIQREKINHDQISTLFWINLALSLGVMLITAALAPAIAWFYGEPRLTWITLVLAGAFIFSGFTIQHQALLRRNMRFGAWASTRIFSIIIGILVAIITAWYGAGYWALVIMRLTESIILAISVWVICRWRPGLPVHRSDVRKMLAFGGHLTGSNFVNYFARNADNILIGKFIGAGALGLYAKAYQLFMMPITQIRSPLEQVAMPVLSSIQKQPGRYIKYYQQLIEIIAFLTIPLTLYCAIEADFLIRILLGNQWIGAVTVFRILAISALIQPVSSTRGIVLVSHGYSHRYFYWGLFNAILIVTSFIIGLPFGIEGVAAAYAVANYAILIPSLFYCFQNTPVTVSLFIKTLALPLLTGLLSAGCVLLAKFVITSDSIISHIFYAGIFMIIYGALSFSRKSIRETSRLLLKGLPIVGKRGLNVS